MLIVIMVAQLLENVLVLLYYCYKIKELLIIASAPDMPAVVEPKVEPNVIKLQT